MLPCTSIYAYSLPLIQGLVELAQAKCNLVYSIEKQQNGRSLRFKLPVHNVSARLEAIIEM